MISKIRRALRQQYKVTNSKKHLARACADTPGMNLESLEARQFLSGGTGVVVAYYNMPFSHLNTQPANAGYLNVGGLDHFTRGSVALYKLAPTINDVLLAVPNSPDCF